MSDAEDSKAGHAPAAKVGNMRVSSHRARNSSSGSGGEKAVSAEELKRQEEEFQSGEVAPQQPKQGQMVAGAVVPEAKAFTPEAVKAYHEKPMPTHEKPHVPSGQQMRHIQQPKK